MRSTVPSRTSTVSARAGAHVLEMQRRRLLAATVEVIYEHGISSLSVATICARAGLSRRTVYVLYDGLEGLFAAAFEDAVQQVRRHVLEHVAGERSWREQVRAGLCALLGFLDSEPATGRLLMVEALAAGELTLEARQRVLAELAQAIDGGRSEVRRVAQQSPLTAEGVVGAVIAVIHARMLPREHEPLLRLVNPLMAMIVQPYRGPAAARSELERPVPAEPITGSWLPEDPFKDLPIRLTYRTVRALSAVRTNPGASNKQVADAAGVNDVGQASKLLHRLQRYGLIQDSGIGPARGMPRAWSLTRRGEGILRAVGEA